MSVIAEQQAQGVFAGIETDLGRRTAVAKMHVVRCRRDGQAQVGQVGVDQEMVVSRIRQRIAGLGHAH